MDAFTLVARLVLDKGEFDSGIASAEAGLNSEEHKSAWSVWGAAMGRLAGRAIEAAIRGSVNFAKSVLQTGMDFDAQMSYVQSIGQMSGEELDAIREKALELGASTKFTAEEVGQAFGYMALAGWDTEEMLAGIDGVLALAAASGEDLGTVSDIVTDALTAFGLTAADATHFVDVLAAASANSNTTVAQMGEAFKYLATTGGVLGYSIDDVATVLGLMANNGIKASQAGTSMRQILNTLINPTTEAAEAMEALGISLFEPGTDKRKPLLQVVKELRQAFAESDFNLEGQTAEEAQKKLSDLAAWYEDQRTGKDSTYWTEDNNGNRTLMQSDLDEEFQRRLQNIYHFNEQFLGQIAEIGGLRGIGSLLALMTATGEDFDQLTGSIENSEGAAGTMAETMIDNLRGDITLLNSAIDGLKILISDEFKGAFRDFVQTITGGIGEMSQAFENGGLLGLFTNLTDWVIDGITNTLRDPAVTIEGATEFGQALGDFVGHLVNKLVTSAPEVIKGLFDAGMNLADGLIQGLFAGLFGMGEGSVYGMISNIEDEKNDAIADANATAVKATGIVSYMQSLVDKYGEAAKNTGEWALALEQLQGVLPGITTVLSNQYDSVTDLTDALGAYIQLNKEAAVLSATEKAVKEYEDALTEAVKGQAVSAAKKEMFQNQAVSAKASMISYLESMWTAAGNEGTIEEFIGESLENKSMDTLKQMALGLLSQWFEKKNTTDLTDEEYTSLLASYESQKTQLDSLTTIYAQSLIDAAAADAAEKDFAEKASYAATMLQVVKDALANLASASNGLATDFKNAGVPSFGGGENGGFTVEGSNAKGLNYVPWDNYVSALHRGEMVLNRSQAEQYRSGDRGINMDVLIAAVAEAVAGAVGNIQINMDSKAVGNAVSGQVSRRIYHDQLGRRVGG